MAEKRTPSRKNADQTAPRSRPTKRPAKEVAPPAAAAPPPPPAPASSVSPPPVAQTRWTLGGRLLVAVLVLLVIAVAVVAALRIRGDGSKAFKLELGVPTSALASDVRSFASASRPVYWIGPANSGTLELTRTTSGAVYVRYLPSGVSVGDRAPSYTTVATYPTPNAYATIQRSGRFRGFNQAKAANGGLAVWRDKLQTSVYLAYPKTDYLVEIYDPSPRRARSLALGTRIRQAP